MPRNLFCGTNELLYLCSWLGKSSLCCAHVSSAQPGPRCRGCSTPGAAAPALAVTAVLAVVL